MPPPAGHSRRRGWCGAWPRGAASWGCPAGPGSRCAAPGGSRWGWTAVRTSSRWCGHHCWSEGTRGQPGLWPGGRGRRSGVTWPGWTLPTGVEAAEWLGELGRDLQEAISCCCFFSATAFWATAGTPSQEGRTPDLPGHRPGHPNLDTAPIPPGQGPRLYSTWTWPPSHLGTGHCPHPTWMWPPSHTGWTRSLTYPAMCPAHLDMVPCTALSTRPDTALCHLATILLSPDVIPHWPPFSSAQM